MEDTSQQPAVSARKRDPSSDLMPSEIDDYEIPSEGEDQEALTLDDHPPSAYYNHKSEKQLISTESKRIYSRHQLELAQQDGEPQSPLARSRTLSMVEMEQLGRPRSESVASRTTGRNYSNRPRAPTLLTSVIQTSNEDFLKGSRHTKHSIPKDRLLPTSPDKGVTAEEQDLNAGVGLAVSGRSVLPEVSEICRNIQSVLDIRRRYISLSLQEPKNDPRNDDAWTIYPPPPDPAWYEDRDRSLRSGFGSSTTILQNSSQPTPKSRKAGQNIGADFDLSDLLPLPSTSADTFFELDENSVYQVYDSRDALERREPIAQVPTLRQYYMDKDKFIDYSTDGPTKSYTYRQLEILDSKFHLHKMENSYQEHTDCKKVPHRDFYNVRKVDTHVHHSACMNQKHLLRFMKSKAKKSPDEVVANRDGTDLTLAEVFARLSLSPYELSIDTLDMHAHGDSFHRFDKFNLKYNPVGESSLREVFLKTDNYIKGRYLAEVTREVISDLESSKYQMVEWRLSIYGKSIDEWDKLASWVIDNQLVSPNVRWLIQIPRLYSTWKKNKIVESFEHMIINIFKPLFEATLDPSSHAKLHIFLQRVAGFDTVDDESKPEIRLYRRFPPAKDWIDDQNPPYTYWIYYLFANIASLNNWRKQRGFATFALRPHCGEAGDPDHLAAAALCCYGINHGITLRKVPFFQYIFYLDQIGIAMSPLSNNALFLTYERNPFPKYFSRGLNVSLSTDDPLQFAFTREPLIEEYAVAAQIYKLSPIDMCELAENSVLQSGFEYRLKRHWLGKNFHEWGVAGNNVAKTNVPDIRKDYRERTLEYEKDCIARAAALNLPPEAVSSTVSRKTSVRSKTPSSPVRATRGIGSRSTLEITKMDGDNGEQRRRMSEMPIRSSSMVLNSSNILGQSMDPGSSMFPGVMHERARRKSIRQGSGSEKDSDGSAILSRSYTRDQDPGLDGSVLELPDEEASD